MSTLGIVWKPFDKFLCHISTAFAPNQRSLLQAKGTCGDAMPFICALETPLYFETETIAQHNRAM